MKQSRRDPFTDAPTEDRDAAHGGTAESGIELSPDDLSPEALRGLIEEFVSREGTDYGHADRALEGKVADVRRQLDAGEARIVFDLESESASIVSARELARHAAGDPGDADDRED